MHGKRFRSVKKEVDGMTMQEREEIFAKECLDSKDFQKL